jgi:hypothetical protein
VTDAVEARRPGSDDGRPESSQDAASPEAPIGEESWWKLRETSLHVLGSIVFP